MFVFLFISHDLISFYYVELLYYLSIVNITMTDWDFLVCYQSLGVISSNKSSLPFFSKKKKKIEDRDKNFTTKIGCSTTEPELTIFHPTSNNFSTPVTSILLDGRNFNAWSAVLEKSFQAKVKMGFLDGSLARPDDPTMAAAWD